ncbi:MAG: S9 family peptidase [Salinivirgaceae bacterium]|nr:MAG: S9 family peptidase [Salinivirgaceae bacterium]
MRKITFLLFISCILLSQLTFAQNKKLTMEDAIVGQCRQLYPQYMNGTWQPESHNFIQQKTGILTSKNADTGEEKTILNLTELNQSLADVNQDTLHRMPRISWIDNKRVYFQTRTNAYTFDIISKTIGSSFTFEKGDANFDRAISSQKNIAVTNANSLYIVTPGERIEVAKSDSDDLVYGQSVSRREFGISKGTFWAPNETLLAYYINDNSDVKQYPLVDITKREAEVEMIRYPMAGMSSEHISLGVYNVATQKTIYIEDKDKDSEKYLTNIAWGPESKYIYIQVLNRGQNHMKLNQYDATTGKLVKTLFEEKHDKYVEPSNPIVFIPNNNEKFIYQTRKDGFNHIYLYNISGKLENQLTKGNWEVTNVLGFDNDNKYIYYQSTEASPLEQQTYRVNIKKAKIEQITRAPGTHSTKITYDGLYAFDSYSSTEVPRVAQFIDIKKLKSEILLEADNPLTDYNIGEMTIETIKAGDGETDLYYRLIKPADFDPNKKYPAVIYVYGGPHAQLITNSWLGGARMWQYYMSQNGYVMLTVDNRGSANRGLKFENVIHRQCGKNEMEDQLKGVELLKSLGYVDMDRIGVHGWSYGGFMTTSLITNYPEIFKVAVAGGPVIDWKYYEIMYGERYMDTPDENPEGYKSTSLLPMASKLKGDLLIIHGYIDPVVVIQNSLSFIRECISNNIPIDYFVYPRAEHNVRGKDRIHLMQKVTDYFEEKLK